MSLILLYPDYIRHANLKACSQCVKRYSWRLIVLISAVFIFTYHQTLSKWWNQWERVLGGAHSSHACVMNAHTLLVGR